MYKASMVFGFNSNQIHFICIMPNPNCHLKALIKLCYSEFVWMRTFCVWETLITLKVKYLYSNFISN